ncbi:MAG TPA: alpha/beta fold hydrolase [Stellaceae bacterium]|jgi:3-oxoadipate enol-lactonase|nr:alpha/beta fold hydrolase [Stellaceae bacterium]
MERLLDPADIKTHRRGNGPVLVLLHCLGVDHRLWDIAAAGLEREFTLLSYDFPGHHETPLPRAAYGIEDLSRQLGAVLAREGIGRAHIAGISLGGLVAQHFAATEPERVDKLLLLDTTPRYTDESRRMWVERAAAAREKGVASFVDTLLKIWFTDGFIAADPPAVRYVRDALSRCSGEGYARACEALGAADLKPLVPQIKRPTLVICGDQEMPPFQEAARWLAATIPGARHALLGPARHCSILEQPEEFRRLTRGFMT